MPISKTITKPVTTVMLMVAVILVTAVFGVRSHPVWSDNANALYVGIVDARGERVTDPRQLESLAQQGDADAQFQLGGMYLTGRSRKGISQNIETALKWLRRAAGQGLADAQLLLGDIYRIGNKLLPKDNVYAHMWFSIAASPGHKDALEHRDRVTKQMTPSQLERAQGLARKWSATPSPGEWCAR